MISCSAFASFLHERGVGFFTGVPDSLLADLTGHLADRFPARHVIAANEGNAIGIAAGFHLATGGLPLVYLQNSGLGNAINPLTSLVSREVHRIPMVLLIGWRGRPGVPDEPQHVTQGRITSALLDLLEIPFVEIEEDTSLAGDTVESLGALLASARDESRPVAILVSSNAFDAYRARREPSPAGMTREEAVILLADALDASDSLIVSTTGKLSRELYEHRLRSGSETVDFYNVGAMGHLSQIGLGLAKAAPDRRVYCFDGDGSALMHLGGLAVAAAQRLENYFYVLFDNGAHDSVGGQPTVSPDLDFRQIATGFGFDSLPRASDRAGLESAAKHLSTARGPVFASVLVRPGARPDLGRPSGTPVENKLAFVNRLRGRP